MGISAKEAAGAVGLSRSGIIKAIKIGRISAKKGRNGEWEIEPSELFRVYPQVQSDSSGISTEGESQSIDGSTEVHSEKVKILEQQIRHLQERLEDKGEVIEDLRRRLDREAEERSKLTALLTDARQNRLETPVESKRGLFSWWGRQKGRDAL